MSATNALGAPSVGAATDPQLPAPPRRGMGRRGRDAAELPGPSLRARAARRRRCGGSAPTRAGGSSSRRTACSSSDAWTDRHAFGTHPSPIRATIPDMIAVGGGMGCPGGMSLRAGSSAAAGRRRARASRSARGRRPRARRACTAQAVYQTASHGVVTSRSTAAGASRARPASACRAEPRRAGGEDGDRRAPARPRPEARAARDDAGARSSSRCRRSPRAGRRRSPSRSPHCRDAATPIASSHAGKGRETERTARAAPLERSQRQEDDRDPLHEHRERPDGARALRRPAAASASAAGDAGRDPGVVVAAAGEMDREQRVPAHERGRERLRARQPGTPAPSHPPPPRPRAP